MKNSLQANYGAFTAILWYIPYTHTGYIYDSNYFKRILITIFKPKPIFNLNVYLYLCIHPSICLILYSLFNQPIINSFMFYTRAGRQRVNYASRLPCHSQPFSISPFREENLRLQSLFCPQICKRHSPICLIVCWIRPTSIQLNLESNLLAASPPLEANQLESIGCILWGDQHTCYTRGALTVIEAVRFECRLYGCFITLLTTGDNNKD